MTSRRRRNSATMVSTAASDSGDSNASTAASWVNAAAHDDELIISVSMRRASSTGMAPNPSRQPHIAHALLTPSSRTVRSAIPSMP